MRTATAGALIALLAAVTGCGTVSATDADGSPGAPYAAGLVTQLDPPGTLLDRPRADDGVAGSLAPPAGGSWSAAWRVGEVGPAETSARRDSPVVEMVAPGPAEDIPGVTEDGSAGDPSTGAPGDDGAVSLPTGVGDDAAGPVGVPTRVQVPRLGIDSNLDELGLRADGELQAPPRWRTAGWFTGGPRPGERGPAVIAGHLDSPSGPAAFASLPDVRPGDRVLVTDARGEVHRFDVDRLARTPKQGFPTRAVYGAVPGAELRLITCTGLFLPSNGGYQDNLLVFARLVRG